MSTDHISFCLAASRMCRKMMNKIDLPTVLRRNNKNKTCKQDILSISRSS